MPPRVVPVQELLNLPPPIRTVASFLVIVYAPVEWSAQLNLIVVLLLLRRVPPDTTEKLIG